MFYSAVDSTIAGLTNRFASSRHVLETFAIFSPSAFPSISGTREIKEKIQKFCKTYKIDSHRCAAELFSFAKAFENFNFDFIENKGDICISDSEDNEDEIEDTNDKTQKTFIDCLSLLTDSKYQLINAYPILVRVYSIAVAIPVTSCSAERSFSTLKHIKSRL